MYSLNVDVFFEKDTKLFNDCVLKCRQTGKTWTNQWVMDQIVKDMIGPWRYSVKSRSFLLLLVKARFLRWRIRRKWFKMNWDFGSIMIDRIQCKYKSNNGAIFNFGLDFRSLL